MRMIRLVLPCALALTAAACASNTAELSDKDRSAIRAASQQYVEADDKRDLDGVMQHIAEGAVYMPANGPIIAGREAIRSFVKPHPWEKVVQNIAEIEGREGLAFVRGSDTVFIQGMTITGNYVELWQKQPDGEWRITRKIWNTDKP